MSDLIEHLGAVREVPYWRAEDDVSVREDELTDDLGKILLLGEDNPQSNRPEFQLYPRPIGCAGERLKTKVLGLTRESDYLAIWRANLCTPVWDGLQARQRAWLLVEAEMPWTTIVLLGRKVAKIFEGMIMDNGIGLSLAPFQSAFALGKTLISLPHPSGRCREWNDPGAYVRAQQLMRHSTPKLSIQWGGSLL